MLIVRGRCFGHHDSYYRANVVLENLLWQWNELKRPFVVYQEERVPYHRRDVIPRWLITDWHLQTHRNFCQCHSVGYDWPGWHRPGTLYSNFVHDLGMCYGDPGKCTQNVGWRYPYGWTKDMMNSEIAGMFSRIVMHALHRAPPPVPPRSEVWSPIPRLDLLDPPVDVVEMWERKFFGDTRRRYNVVHDEG